MNITIQQFRKHSLSLALLAGLGLSGSALMAQESATQQIGSPPPAYAPDTRAAAEANARASARYASRLEAMAREAAREAQQAARVAADFRDRGAPTQHAADTAKATSHTAHQAAMAAQKARNEAIQSAQQARTGMTVADDGVNPTEGAVEAQVGALQTEQATRAALDAATRANEAAAATAKAAMPPVSGMDTSQQRPTQTAAGQATTAQSDVVEQVVLEREGQPVVITSRPNLMPEDTSVSGDYSMNFSDMDENGDGFISREEAQVNPTLGDEFTAADRNNDGMLSAAELQDWTR